MKQPNILFIMTDEMRFDCMGFIKSCLSTPNLDTLAAQGTYFTHAYSACPSCIPARAALLTGLSQDGHRRYGYQDRVPWNYPVTLGGEMTRLGYQTRAIGKMHVHPSRSLHGFMHVELHDGYLHAYRNAETPYHEHQKNTDDYLHFLRQEAGTDADIIDSGLECNSWAVRPWPYEERLHPTNWVTSRAIDFLRTRDREKPFFLMASYVRPHAPYDPPAAFYDLYKDASLPEPVSGDWNNREMAGREARVVNNIFGPPDSASIRRQQAGYYACISHIDNQIGRLLQALTDDGSLQDTLILFTSDHGEMLSDHGFCRKALPYEGSAHIPLILKGPGIPCGAKCDALTELRDILPTLVELGGGEVPGEVEGQSLKNDLTGAAEKTHVFRPYLHGEHAYGALSNHFIVTQEDKYIWFSEKECPLGEAQYFNLHADPYETHNRIHDPACAERIRFLHTLLIQELKNRPEGFVSADGNLQQRG